MKKPWSIVICFFLVTLTLPSSPKASEALEFLLFQEIPVTTPSKTKRSIKEAPSTITVITEEEIRLSGAQNYLDVLKMVPGIEVSMARYGQYEIVIRGIKTTGTEKVLVLINGHSVNEAFFGSAMTLFDDLTVDNIKKIEVIRGPGSALYGANAFTGIINIVTKKGSDTNGVEVTASSGSFNTRKGGILFGSELNEWDIGGYVEYYKTDGFKSKDVTRDLQTIFDSITGSNASLAPGQASLPKEKIDFNLNLSKENLSINTKFLSRQRGDYIGLAYALADESDMDLQQGFLDIKHKLQLSPNFSLKYSLYYDYFYEDILFQVFPGGYMNSFGEIFPEGYLYGTILRNHKVGGDFQGHLQINEENQLLFGFFYEYLEQDKVRFKTNANPITDQYLGHFGDVTERWNWNKELTRKIWSTYIQDEVKIFDKGLLTLGVRHDDYDDFGGTTNSRIGFIWNLMDQLTTKFLFGQAFRAPNFRELYDRNNANTIGNENLSPETIDSLEFNLIYQNSHFFFRSAFFHNIIENVIIEGPKPSPSEPSPFINIDGDTKVTGVEVEGRVALSKHNYLYCNYSFQDSKGTNGENLPDIPRHKGNIGFNIRLASSFNFNSNLFISGERPRENGDTRKAIPSYELVNLNLIYTPPIKGMEVSLAVQNLFNEAYVEPGTPIIPDDYPQSKQALYGTVKFKF